MWRRSSILDVVEACFGNAKPFVNHEVERELIPFTQMTENLQSATEKFLAEYKGMRAASDKGGNQELCEYFGVHSSTHDSDTILSASKPSSISRPEPAKPVSTFTFAPTPVTAPATSGSAASEHWKNFSFGSKAAASTFAQDSSSLKASTNKTDGAANNEFFPFPKTIPALEKSNAFAVPSSATSSTAASSSEPGKSTPAPSFGFGPFPAALPTAKAPSKRGSNTFGARPSASTANEPLAFGVNATQAAPEASKTPSKPGFSDLSNGLGKRAPFASPVEPIWNKSPSAGMFVANQSTVGPFTPAVALDQGEKINQILGHLAELGYTGLVADDLNKLRPGDEFEEELKVMAEVRGYFQVSFTVGLST